MLRGVVRDGAEQPDSSSRPVVERSEWRLAALTALGQVHAGVFEGKAAEEYFRRAIAVGREIGLGSRELARLHASLAKTLSAPPDADRGLKAAEEGLALLGDETDSLEAVLLNQIIARIHLYRVGVSTYRRLTLRCVPLLERLPYTGELLDTYVDAVNIYASTEHDCREAMRWAQRFVGQAQQHQDWRAVGEMYCWAGDRIFVCRGDLRGAIPHYQQAREHFAKLGDASREGHCLYVLGAITLSLGDLPAAEAYAAQELKRAESQGLGWYLARAHRSVGLTEQARGDWDRAAESLKRAVELFRQAARKSRSTGVSALLPLGRVYWRQGKLAEARRVLRQGLAAEARYDAEPHLVAYALSGMEEACADPAAFRAFCDRFRAEHPRLAATLFRQWALEPAQPHGFAGTVFRETFDGLLSAAWTWRDPFEDGSCTVHDGLELRAANGRDLWCLNRGAPQLLRSHSGDFAVQTICRSIGRQPAIGGLLLWKDDQNYLRLTWGGRSVHEISLLDCIQDQGQVLGRGRLPAERVFLRLERVGEHVRALCSADGEQWFSVGQGEFAVSEPVQVGIHAIGQIDRTIYPGAHPEGTAIRFTSFEIWS